MRLSSRVRDRYGKRDIFVGIVAALRKHHHPSSWEHDYRNAKSFVKSNDFLVPFLEEYRYLEFLRNPFEEC